MKTRLSYLKEVLKSAFWLTPAMTAIGLTLFLFAVQAIEGFLPPDFSIFGHNTLEGTRLVLSSIATAVMTVVGVLFSVTVVVLQQVSQQYSPRVIENFVRSTANQIVLGFYIGTFAYSLLLLRTIQPVNGASRVPQLAPTGAILLALICLALLIFFIHSLAKSIKSNHILADISRQAVETLTDLQDDADEEGARGRHEASEGELVHAITRRSSKNGYLQEVNWSRLRSILSGMRWEGRLCVIPGDYIRCGMSLIQLKTAAPLSAEQCARIDKLFKIDLERTHSQDVRFGIRQMVDVGLRALSPGINDPTTAIEALNEIGTVLWVYTHRCAAGKTVSYAGGGRLYLKEPGFREFVDLCVNEIAVAGKDYYLVQQQIGILLAYCQQATSDPERTEVLRSKVESLQKEIPRPLGAALYR